MKTVISVTLAAFFASYAHFAAAQQIELFNGKDLNGWIPYLTEDKVSPSSVWTVADGILTCKGEPLGYLYTERSFENFKLEVTYRWKPGTTPGNNGIFSRIQDPKSGPIPRCVETQLNAGEAGDLMTMQGMAMSRDQPRFFHIANHELAGEVHGVKATKNLEVAGEKWNKIIVIAKDDTYSVEMNNERINTATGIPAIAGPIGLQCEGGVIQFQEVKIESLDE
jgi:hypothetical protein